MPYLSEYKESDFRKCTMFSKGVQFSFPNLYFSDLTSWTKIIHTYHKDNVLNQIYKLTVLWGIFPG